MAIGLNELPPLYPVAGIRLAVAKAGVRYPGRDDVVLISCDEGSVCAGVYTRNVFCAAPVQVAKTNMLKAPTRALLINSGNANAGTGDAGMQAALDCCSSAAREIKCQPEQVLPFSTGVIGELLPAAKIKAVIPALVSHLQEDGWAAAAKAIMTTDTVAKGVSLRIELAGKPVTITAIAKGSGMIRPDMATMLAYIGTDIHMQQDLLQACLQQAVEGSFNRITVDGDTSTNDACMLMATGKSGLTLSSGSADTEVFIEALASVCQQLAQAVIRDGEGVTKFITIQVEGGASSQECLQVAYTIAHSPLVKTAFFASDPNWGRILAAVGRSGLEGLDVDKVNLYLDDVCIVHKGGRATAYTEEQGQAVMKQDEITIKVELGRGQSTETVWTTDLSYDYVKINAEYRS